MRYFLMSMAIALACFATASTASAQSVVSVFDFEDLGDTFNRDETSVSSDGLFSITETTPSDTFAAVQNGDPGNQVIFIGPGTAGRTSGDLQVSAVAGGALTAFSLNSLDLNLTTGTAGTDSVTIAGSLNGASVFSQDVLLDAANGAGYVTVTVNSASIDTLTLSQSTLGNGNRFDNISITTGTAVPEPTSMTLIALAGMGICFSRRRS